MAGGMGTILPRGCHRVSRGKNRGMDLRGWITAEHSANWARFSDGVASRVPLDRWTEHPDDGGSCLAQLVFHVTLHADMALHAVVLDQSPLVNKWRDRLGLSNLLPHKGLPEAEDAGVVAAIQVPVLVDYAAAVHEATGAWLTGTDLAQLDEVPPASERLRKRGLVSVDSVPWLHAMWTDKPVSWFVQWECIGHALNHLGEMVAVRNRMGLSPF